ncbi:MAG TPA: hypothetical protein VEI02_01675 [Planctomycetota bacterium]|nr:hypothetical protein [Planctomycetota bacterium]
MNDRCPWCGQPACTVYVHGHGQCARCGVNIDPCCAGSPTYEDAPPDADRRDDG